MQSTRSLQQNNISCDFDPLSPELFDIISYPRFNASEYLERISEIQSLGVKSIISRGRLKIGKLLIAGKGTVSLVLRSKSCDNKVCALKIRRIDSNRRDLHQEARLHTTANTAGIGPKILAHTKNIILMEFIEGSSIVDWVNQDEKTADSETILEIVSDILVQCHNLDKLHLDHGQLHHLNHHVIISESSRATILDFESASYLRRTSNVTSASNSLLLGGHISERITDILRIQGKKERLVRALKLYKLSHNEENLQEILYLLKE
jgi:putative serine/threonine protein kinase